MSATTKLWKEAHAELARKRLADVFDRDANTANTLAEMAQTIQRALYRTAEGEKRMNAERLAGELHDALLALHEEYVGRSAEYREEDA